MVIWLHVCIYEYFIHLLIYNKLSANRPNNAYFNITISSNFKYCLHSILFIL